MSEENPSKNLIGALPEIEAGYNGKVGCTADLCNEAFIDLLKRVQQTGKAGTITITVSVSRKDDARMDMVGKVAVKLPEMKPDARSFYMDKQGRISTNDPRQPDLPNVRPLKAV